MNVLIRHEESQCVMSEFLRLGHDAYSNDIQNCSGPHPDRHLKADTLSLEGGFDFEGAHPECTFLTNSGVRWLYNADGSKNKQRWVSLEKAVLHFNEVKRRIRAAGLGYLENPIPHKYAREGFHSVIDGHWVQGIGKYDQLVQPWQFGHGETKATCLWLVGLPKLEPTEIVPGREARIHKMPPGPERSKERSKTYTGIARAMAEQWGIL